MEILQAHHEGEDHCNVVRLSSRGIDYVWESLSELQVKQSPDKITLVHFSEDAAPTTFTMTDAELEALYEARVAFKKRVEEHYK